MVLSAGEYVSSATELYVEKKIYISNWNLEMLIFEEREKPEDAEKNLPGCKEETRQQNEQNM